MELDKALSIAASGMDAQTTRLRVIAENLANQDTTGSKPGADPYRRKTVAFENQLDRQLGAQTVRVKQVGQDKSDFPLRYDPSNPAANAQGYVKEPPIAWLTNPLTSLDIPDESWLQGRRFGRRSA